MYSSIWEKRRARTFKGEVWSEVEKRIVGLGELQKILSFIQSSRGDFTPLLRTLGKRTVLQTIAGHTCLFLCGLKNGRKQRDLKQEWVQVVGQKRKKSRTKPKKDAQSKLSGQGCLHLIVLVDSIAGLCFHKREHDFLSLYNQCVYMHFPWPVVSVDNWLHHLIDSNSKAIGTSINATQLAVFQKVRRQIEVNLLSCTDAQTKKISETENKVTVVLWLSQEP